jgi:hypothetical protein
MANNITRIPRQQMARPQQQGVPSQQWWGGMPGWGGSPGWNGDNDCCPDSGAPPFPCPPPGFPPPGCPPWFSGQNSPPWYPGANAGVSFGTSPPPNPVRGHFWWDGTTLWIFDGAAWTAAGGGAGGQGAASVAIGTSPPVAPQPGALWFDGAMLLLWNGNAWVPTEGNASGPTAPTNPTAGMLWWNGSTLMVWDGVAWVAVSQTKSYIQSTAPASPNPGDTWWNGTQMRIWDGTAWELVGPGATVGPVPTTTLVFSISAPGNLTLSSTSNLTPIQFTAVPTIDTMNAWSAGNWQYKPSKAGIYAVMGQGNAQISNSGYAMAICKNDSGTFTGSTLTAAIWDMMGAGPVNQEFTMFGMIYMNGTTDYLRAFGAANNATWNSTGSEPVFQAWILP